MKPLARLLRAYFTLGTTIIGALPNNILDGQAVDAVPVMADFNWIVSQVNANAAATTDMTTAITNAIAAVGNPFASFTPAVAFGGASTGITYVAQQGQYVQIGKIVFFTLTVHMTSKGSSTGAMTIGGLPVTISNAISTNIPVPISVSFSASNPANQFVGLLVPNTKTLSVSSLSNAGNIFNLSDLNCNNGTGVDMMGWYPSV